MHRFSFTQVPLVLGVQTGKDMCPSTLHRTWGEKARIYYEVHIMWSPVKFHHCVDIAIPWISRDEDWWVQWLDHPAVGTGCANCWIIANVNESGACNGKQCLCHSPWLSVKWHGCGFHCTTTVEQVCTQSSTTDGKANEEQTTILLGENEASIVVELFICLFNQIWCISVPDLS